MSTNACSAFGSFIWRGRLKEAPWEEQLNSLNLLPPNQPFRRNTRGVRSLGVRAAGWACGAERFALQGNLRRGEGVGPVDEVAEGAFWGWASAAEGAGCYSSRKA